MTTENEEKGGQEVGEGAAPAAAADPIDPVAEAKAEAAKNKELFMRTAADFDNFRKRSRKEVEDARRSGREELLKELLPVFDNLERGIQSAQRATDVKAVADGLTMILKQFEGTLGRIGIQRVPTVGSGFDPSVHEAIQQVETDEHPPGTVVAEVQPGYKQEDRLVRAAMVVVAKPKAGGNDGKADPAGPTN
ncbi:MAG: nucleotide exchange factor GrpE [Polyangiaceae bacterium]